MYGQCQGLLGLSCSLCHVLRNQRLLQNEKFGFCCFSERRQNSKLILLPGLFSILFHAVKCNLLGSGLGCVSLDPKSGTFSCLVRSASSFHLPMGFTLLCSVLLARSQCVNLCQDLSRHRGKQLGLCVACGWGGLCSDSPQPGCAGSPDGWVTTPVYTWVPASLS